MRRYLILLALCLCGIILASDKHITGDCPGAGGGGSTPPGGRGGGAPALQRPPLGVGLQPLIQSIQSLANVADPWEAWWSRNRDRYLSFREPVQWTDIVDKGGSKSFFVSPLYDELMSILSNGMGDKDPDLAFRAAIALGKFQDSTNPSAGSQRAIEILKKANETETRFFVKNNVILGLGLSADDSAVAIIKDVLQKKDNSPLKRSFAAMALGYSVNNPGAATALREILSADKEDREVKSSCCISLGNLKDVSAVPALGKILNGEGGRKEQGMIRAYAALGLGRIGTREALDELKKAAPADEKESDVRLAIVTALGMSGLPGARDNIPAFLQDKIPTVRGMACIALAQIKDAKAYETISEAFRKNKSTEAEGLMVLALALTGHEKAKPDLRKILSSDNRKTRPLLKAAAAIGLGLLKDNDAVEIIVNILKDNKQQYDTAFSPYLILALAMINKQKAKETAGELSEMEKQELEILQKMWARVDKNINVVAYTNLAIAMMRLTSRDWIIEQLLGHASANDAVIRVYALHTLGLLGNRDSAKVFINAAKDNNPDVRKAAVAAVGFMMDKNPVNPIDKITSDSVDIQMVIMDHILPIPVW